jgi:hypothetical protein
MESMNIKDCVDAVAPSPQRLKDVQNASKRRGTHKPIMRGINAEMAAARRERLEGQRIEQPTRRAARGERVANS